VNARKTSLVAAVILVWIAGIVIANHYFFPLKVLYHWDEAIRYVHPGLDQHHYSIGEIFSALSGSADKGRLNVFILRIIRNFFPENMTAALITYKNLILGFNVMAVAWFSKKVLKIGSMAGILFVTTFFLAAPMTWIQANEVMSEPLALPLALLWIGFVTHEWESTLTFPLFAKLTLCSLLLLFANFNILIQVVLFAFLAGILLLFLQNASVEVRLRRLAGASVFTAGATALALLLWFVSHWNQVPFLNQVYFLIRPFMTELTFPEPLIPVFDTTAGRLLFGLRNFGWLSFPALILLIPSGWTLIRRFRDLPETARFSILSPLIAIPLAAKAYATNSQARYHHLTNTLLLLAVAYGLYLFICQLRELKGAFFRREVVSRLANTTALALLLGYVVTEYAPLYATLGSQANVQLGGVYNGDKADADHPRSFFSLLPRTRLVTFPYLSYRAHLPNRTSEQPDISKLKEKIAGLLEKGLYPCVSPSVMPNYLNQKSMELLYYEKFGEYPSPPIEGMPVQYLSVSFPEGSVYDAAIYSMLDKRSQSSSLKAWEEEVGNRPHTMTFEENTGDVTLLVAQGTYILPHPGPIVDWDSLDSIRSFVATRERNGAITSPLWKFSSWILNRTW